MISYIKREDAGKLGFSDITLQNLIEGGEVKQHVINGHKVINLIDVLQQLDVSVYNNMEILGLAPAKPQIAKSEPKMPPCKVAPVAVDPVIAGPANALPEQERDRDEGIFVPKPNKNYINYSYISYVQKTTSLRNFSYKEEVEEFTGQLTGVHYTEVKLANGMEAEKVSLTFEIEPEKTIVVTTLGFSAFTSCLLRGLLNVGVEVETTVCLRKGIVRVSNDFADYKSKIGEAYSNTSEVEVMVKRLYKRVSELHLFDKVFDVTKDSTYVATINIDGSTD